MSNRLILKNMLQAKTATCLICDVPLFYHGDVPRQHPYVSSGFLKINFEANIPYIHQKINDNLLGLVRIFSLPSFKESKFKIAIMLRYLMTVRQLLIMGEKYDRQLEVVKFIQSHGRVLDFIDKYSSAFFQQEPSEYIFNYMLK